MKYLEKDNAISLLEESYLLNEGPWREHSYNVASAAKKIAEKTALLDADRAYTLGLIHDIGRRFGFSYMKHVIDGYRFLSDLGYEFEAKICLTHSFPIKNVYSYNGKLDCTKADLNFISEYLRETTYDDYDLLIQLCYALASKDGYCILEQRLIDVAIRNGINEYSVEKWKSFIALKSYFDDKINMNIYDLLDIYIK